MSKYLHLFFIIMAGLGLAAIFLLVLPDQQKSIASTLTTITVNTLEDEDNTDGDCALREAIRAANENAGVDACLAGDAVLTDTIAFSVGGTVTLTEQLGVTAGGALVIDGADAITISGGGSVRLFYVNVGADLELGNLNLVDGNAGSGDGGGIYNLGTLTINGCNLSGNSSEWYGGAIHNRGTVCISDSFLSDNSTVRGGGAGIHNYNNASATIDSSTLSGNIAGWYGGGIYNWGLFVITDSTISGNRAETEGGGIQSSGTMTATRINLTDNFAGKGGGISAGGTMEITDSFVTGNSTGDFGQGGGIYTFDGILTMTNSTVSDNTAGWYGGGIANTYFSLMVVSGSTLSGNFAGSGGGGVDNSTSTLILVNSTVSGNSSDNQGGGILNQGMLTVTSSTLSGNDAVEGGGIYNYFNYLGMTTVSSSIVANSLSVDNCAGEPIIDGGYNIDSQDTCGFLPANNSMPNTDPLLGPLEDKGGRTLTHALLDGSPAIDSGDPLNCPSTDQRRAPRPYDGDGDGEAICDIGSYEWVNLIILYPPSQHGSGALGVTVVDTIELYNFTELTDTYTLELGSHTWETALSMGSFGPLSSGDSQPFTVSVRVPDTATWYMTDTVVVTATSITSPTMYWDAASIITQAYAPPQISISPTELSSKQVVDQVVTLPLTISNGLGVPLTYSVYPSEVTPWLSIDPDSGTVGTKSSEQVQITLDSNGLSADVYTTTLIVESNDPETPSVPIPVTMTVKDSFARSYMPLISKETCPASNILNGDFELGVVAWIEGGPYVLPGDIIRSNFWNPHCGTWVGALRWGFIDQEVSIPEDEPYLSYWYWVRAVDQWCPGRCLQAFVQINGTTIRTHDLNYDSTRWKKDVIDLTDYAGQEVILRFDVQGNAYSMPLFVIDDVNFQSSLMP